MNYQQSYLTKSVAIAVGVLSILGSAAGAADPIPSMWPKINHQTGRTIKSVRRSGFAPWSHRKPYRIFCKRSSFLDQCLLGDGIRGGAAKADQKEETKDGESEETEDLDKILESELIEEVETPVDKGDTDEEDENVSDVDIDNEIEEDEEAEADEVGTELLEESSEYDEPLVAPVMLQMYATLGVMMLSKKVDLYNPTVVRAARFAFIGYLVLLQLFLLYVRIRAKIINDRRPVTIANPLSGLLQSQLGPAGGNDMVKNLASSFLKSESTVLEYDMKQAKSMQGGLIFNMAFMWLLHFKFEQIQPLLINTVSGLMNLAYSPLFQAYVLGRNLERPFKNLAMQKYESAASAAAENGAETTTNEEADSVSDSIESEELAEEEEDASDADDNGDQKEEEEGGAE